MISETKHKVENKRKEKFKTGFSLKNKAHFEQIVATNYESIFLIFNALLEDPQGSLQAVDDTLRLAEQKAERQHSLEREEIYALAVEKLKKKLENKPLVAGFSFVDTMCWLLKEFGVLNYHKIGKIMHLERDEVKHRIADIRLKLLCVSEI